MKRTNLPKRPVKKTISKPKEKRKLALSEKLNKYFSKSSEYKFKKSKMSDKALANISLEHMKELFNLSELKALEVPLFKLVKIYSEKELISVGYKKEDIRKTKKK